MKKVFLAIAIVAYSAGLYSQCAVNITTKAVTCNGLCTGTATARATGGTAPYAYVWSTSPVQSAAGATGLCAGAYTVTITDSKGCSATNSGTVNQPAALAIVSTNKNVTCFGLANGTATATVSGGTARYTYAWSTSPTQTTKTATKLAPGSYTVTVTDRNGCSATATETITQPAIITLTTSSTAASCSTPNGSAAVTAVGGGTSPYVYTWSNGASSATDANIGAGNYYVTLTDANKCTSSATVSVANSSGLSTGISSTNVTCFNAGNGTATANPSGGQTPYTYSWSNAATTAAAGNLVAGTYTVTVTDGNACTVSSTVKITRPAAALSAKMTMVKVTCFGGTNGSITAVPAGGTAPYTYMWSTSPTQTTAAATGLTPAKYYVTITDANGCSLKDSSTVTQPLNIAVTAAPTNVKCFGGATGSARATGTGGTTPYTYTWSTTPVQTVANATGLAPGIYTVTLSDKNGCVAVNTVTITQPASGTTLTVSSVASGCSGATGSATVAATGGTAPYTYRWSGAGGATAATDSPLAAGTYTVSVTDANGCRTTTTEVVNNTSGLTVSVAGTNLTCSGSKNGSVTATVVGGTPAFTYSWSGGASGQTGAVASNLASGNYTVTVVDAAGCSFTAKATLTQPTRIRPTITKTNETCPGSANGSASITTTGGVAPYTYSWSTGSTAALVSALAAAKYYVTITDASGCTHLDSTTVTQPAAIASALTNVNVTCFGGSNGVGSAAITGGTAPYTYLWATNPVQTTKAATGLIAGTYSLTVTDSKGCTATTTDVITQPASIVPAATSTNAACGQSSGSVSAAPTGGSGTYAYSWSNGATTASVGSLAAGSYNVTVTDSKGCTATSVAVVNSSGGATVAINSNSVVNDNCNGGTTGSAIATASGGTGTLTYSWSNGITSATASGLIAGTYTVSVTDANNCQSFSNVTITQPASINILLAQSGTSCSSGNGSISSSVSGGSPSYTYLWSNTSTTASISGVSPGGYTLTVTDANTCSMTSALTLTAPAAITATFLNANVSCNGGSDGSATAMVAGGTPAYTYSWSSGDTGANAVGLAAGTYSVTVTDANACSAILTTSVTQMPKLSASVTNQEPSCNGGTNGSAAANVAGGLAPYIYQWSTNPIQTTASASGLSAGIYNLTVNDKNGCITTYVDTLLQPAVIGLVPVVGNATCGSSTGSAAITASGGSGSYTYSWSTGSTSASASATSNLPAGSYNVSVTDSKGCSANTAVIITNANGETASIGTVVSPVCSNGATGSAIAAGNGGTGTFTYSWSGGTNPASAAVTGLSAGSYTVTVTDGNGCLAYSNVTITAPPATLITMTSVPVLCNGGATGTASANVSGGSSPYTYAWTGAQTSAIANKLAAGTYTLSVTDANGCVSTSTAIITQPAGISMTFLNSKLSCNGDANGTATATANGGTPGYSYIWSNGDSSAVASAMTAGVYTLTVMDVNGCSANARDTITQPAAIGLTATTTTANCGTANGTAMVTANGGSAPYIYSWSTSPVQTTQTATAMMAGLYVVAVSDSIGCTQTLSVTISNISSGAVLTVAGTEPTCNGYNNGSITANVSGGNPSFTYSWSTSPPQTTATATNLVAGTYSVEVTDKNGCIIFDTLTIIQPSVLALGKSSVNATCPTCVNGTATVSAAGGTSPYTYSWSTSPIQTTPTATGLAAGIYSFCVTDSKGCVSCDTITLMATPLGVFNFASGATPLSIKTYPNPTSGEFKVEIVSELKQDMYIRVVDLVGQVVYTDQQLQGTVYNKTIDLQNYSNGMYILQLLTPDRSYTQRIVLQR